MDRWAKILYLPDGYKWRIYDEQLECSIVGFNTCEAAARKAESLGFKIRVIEKRSCKIKIKEEA